MRLPAILLVAVTVACQPVPQPFSHVETGSTATLDLPDSGGIVVLELAEAPAPTAAGMAQAVAEALADRNVPAGTGSGNSRSYFLQGVVEDDGRDATIAWTLYHPNGDVIDTVRQSIEGTPVTLWARADPALMRRLADQVATKIATLIQGATPTENVTPALYVAEVTGAPGAGNRQLRSALRRHLTRLGLVLSDSASAPNLTVRGTVDVGAPERGHQMASLEWRVIDADNVEVGKIAQSNPVTAGSLDGSWGSIADIAARGAAEGIDALVRRVDWTARDQEVSSRPGPAKDIEKARR